MGGMATSPTGEAGSWTVSDDPTVAIRSLVRDSETVILLTSPLYPSY